MQFDGRNPGEAVEKRPVYAASRMSQLRKSSSAASQPPSAVGLPGLSLAHAAPRFARRERGRVQPPSLKLRCPRPEEPVFFGNSVTLLRVGAGCDVTCDVTPESAMVVSATAAGVGGIGSHQARVPAPLRRALFAARGAYRHHGRRDVTELRADDPVRPALPRESRQRRVAAVMEPDVRESCRGPQRSPGTTPRRHRARGIQLLVLTVPGEEIVIRVGDPERACTAVQFAQRLQARLVQRRVAPAGRGVERRIESFRCSQQTQ